VEDAPVDPLISVPPERFAAALLTLASQPAMVAPQRMAALLLTAHHPRVAGRVSTTKPRRADHVWRRLFAKMCVSEPNLPFQLNEVASDVVEVLLGEQGLTSARAAEREAAAAAVASAAADWAEALTLPLLDAARVLADSTAHDALTRNQVGGLTPPTACVCTVARVVSRVPFLAVARFTCAAAFQCQRRQDLDVSCR